MIIEGVVVKEERDRERARRAGVQTHRVARAA
jgi:hypothetical protein